MMTVGLAIGGPPENQLDDRAIIAGGPASQKRVARRSSARCVSVAGVRPPGARVVGGRAAVASRSRAGRPQERRHWRAGRRCALTGVAPGPGRGRLLLIIRRLRRWRLRRWRARLRQRQAAGVVATGELDDVADA